MPKNKVLVLGNSNKQENRIEIRNQTEESAELYFYGDICSETWQSEWYAEDVAPKDVINFLSQIGDVQTIHVHFNSGGGSVNGGIAIKNLLKAHNAKMIGYVDGIAASIAGVILMACDEIHVYSSSIFMMHKPLTAAFGNADDLSKEIEALNTCQDAITNIFMEKAKEDITREKITEMINAETWLTGDELTNYFNDIIVEESTQAVASVGSEFFDKYKNVPANLKSKKDETLNKDDVQKMIDKALEKINAPTNSTNDTNNTEKEKEELLNDLDLI